MKHIVEAKKIRFKIETKKILPQCFIKFQFVPYYSSACNRSRCLKTKFVSKETELNMFQQFFVLKLNHLTV